MKKIILTILILAVNSIVHSQEKDSVKTYFSGEILVTAERNAVIKTSSTEIIDLKSSGEINISESLRGISGVNLYQNSRNESLIKMRGFDQRQIGIFFNGIPFYVLFDGNADLSQISPLPLRKIIISKNMPSVLYGMNTLGGSVNIISDEPENGIHTNANLTYGKQFGGSFMNNGGYKFFNWLISGTFMKSNNYELPVSFSPQRNENDRTRDNSSFIRKEIFMKAGIFLPENNFINIFLSKTFNAKDVPVNIYTVNPRFWKFTDFNNTILGIISDLKIIKGINLKTNIYTVNHFNILKSYDDNSFTSQTKSYAFTSTYNDYTTGITLIPEMNFNKIFSAGFSFHYKRDTHYEQPNLNQVYKKFVIENYSLGMEKNIELKNFDISAGIAINKLKVIYADGNLLRNGITSVSGHLGIGRNFANLVYPYFNFSKTTRFPTLKELFSELVGKNISNPDLTEEKSWNFEAGVKISGGNIGNFNLAFHYSYVKDMIFQVLIQNNRYQYQNIPEVILNGIEISYKNQTKYLDINFNFSYLYARNKSGTDSDKLEYRPVFSSNLILSKEYKSLFEWQIEIFYTGKRYCIDGDTKQWKTLPDYTLFNFRISREIFSFMKIFFSIENITDKYYETEYGFPQEGRTFTAGAQINF